MSNKHKTERSAHRLVEPPMNGGKHILVILLSALWLCASGQSLLAPCNDCGTTASASLNCALDSGKDCPCSPFAASDAAATAVHPRVAKHSGKASPLACENSSHS